MIKIITSNGTNQHHMSPGIIHQGHTNTCVVFLPKMCNLFLIVKKSQINTNRGTFCKIKGLRCSKMLSSWKTIKNNGFRLKKCKEIPQLNAMCDTVLNPVPKLLFFFFYKGDRVGWDATPKRVIRSTDKILINSFINIHFLILIIVLWWCKRLSWFWKCTLKYLGVKGHNFWKFLSRKKILCIHKCWKNVKQM